LTSQPKLWRACSNNFVGKLSEFYAVLLKMVSRKE
jgi:hypothetical protein